MKTMNAKFIILNGVIFKLQRRNFQCLIFNFQKENNKTKKFL